MPNPIHTRREPKPMKTDLSTEILPDLLATLDEAFPEPDVDAEFLKEAATERINAGNAEYGQPLYSFDGRENLTDWWQEAVDQVVYAHKEMMENTDDEGVVQDDELCDLYDTAVDFAISLAAYIRTR